MKINRMLLAALGGLVITGSAAVSHAEAVVYSTLGAFGGTAAGELSQTIVPGTVAAPVSSITVVSANGTAVVTFDGEVADAVDAPTFNPLGTFVVTSTATAAHPVNLTGITFTLSVTQTVPGAGSGSFGTGAVSGTLSTTSSGTFVTFASPTLIGPFPGDVTYALLYNPVELVSPSAGGTTTIQGDIEAPEVPTPATFVGGSALMGMMLAAKSLKRRRMA